jgi:transposase-like protein
MVHELVVCPYCHGTQVAKRGKTDAGKQRYRCQHEAAPTTRFSLSRPTRDAYPRANSKPLR